MTNHQQHSLGVISDRFRRLYHHPISYFAVLSFSYLILLIISYGLGYLRGSSLGVHRLSMLVHGRLATRCADSVPPERVRQTVIDRFYNGTSPYEDFIPPTTINSPLIANLTGRLGLKTQILCLGDFHEGPEYNDQNLLRKIFKNTRQEMMEPPKRQA
uniref:Uncharacterized protein n=1 Tax=Opuntia streptacantha TaxID=393608 RepID=A0A7C9EHC6_OPUST